MPNSVRADSQHVARTDAEPVQIMPVKDVRRLMSIRAVLSALVAGLGALAGAATHETITLQGWITAAAAAAAAAGAVFGVGNGNGTSRVQTDITRRDFESLRKEEQKR